MIPDAKSGAPKALVTIGCAAVLAALTACDPAGPEPRGPIDDDTYVAVMSELADIRRFPPGGRDQVSRDAASDSARRAVLERHGVTVEDLLGFAEIVGEHPTRMVEIAERISAVTDSLADLRSRGTRAEDAADTTGTADTAGLRADPTREAPTRAVRTDTSGTDAGAADADDAAPRPIGERDDALRERIERLRDLREERRP